MSSKASFVLIFVDHLDAEVNFYRRVLGVRELKTWADSHVEKAALFDMVTLKLVIAQERQGSPVPHKPAAAKGRVWVGLQAPGDITAYHQTAGVGKTPQQISQVHDSPWSRGRCFYAVDSEGNPVIVTEEALDTSIRTRLG
jgi:catechol 2,3-dioxygenase-like lactoylglutathione lyase family enzyme